MISAYLYTGIYHTVFILVLFFSACMFWDCVQRDPKDFSQRFGLKEGRPDKVVWLFLILLGIKMFGVPALAYYLIERQKKVDLPWDSSTPTDKKDGEESGT